MLEEEEFSEVARLYRDGFRGQRASVAERFRPVSEAYERMTGYAGCPANAVMHHRIALYGPPCVACGKPLRTGAAKHCAACGAERQRS